MASILVLEPDLADREFILTTLRGAGHTARAASADEPLGVADLVLAAMPAAVARGWFRPSAAPPSEMAVVITSPFSEFLRTIEGAVTGTLQKPTTSDALRAVIERALARQPSDKIAAPDPLDLPARDASVDRHRAADPALDAIAELIARGAGTPMGLVTIVRSDVQTFIGQVGLPPDMAGAGETPRSWSFCQHAVRAETSLVIEDAKAHPLLATTPLVEMSLVGAYAGVPIEVDGQIVGTVCALSDKPHRFEAKEMATLNLAARLVSAHLSQRAHPDASKVKTAPEGGGGSTGTGRKVGDTLDKYVVTARLGKGGVSEVLLARDRTLGQLVAIKVMLEANASDETLLREAKALASVRHPNVVQVHGWGRTEEGALYLVLEYVAGRTLHDRLYAAASGKEPVDVGFVLKTVREIGGALATLHAHGVVHGDIKPDNILLDPNLDRAVLIDFGLGLGGVLRGGTPGYSAPEQFARDKPLEATPALDVYALGAVSYFMLSGTPPFDRASPMVRIGDQRRGVVAPPSRLRAGIPPAVDAVVLRALAVDPARRHESVLAFVDAMTAALKPSESTPLGAVAHDAEPKSRGVTFRYVREEVRRARGGVEELALLASLSEDDRTAWATASDDATWYPAGPLAAYLTAYGAGDPTQVEALAATVTAHVLPRVLQATHVARTPIALLHIAPTLLHRFHDWSRLRVLRTGTNDATVTLQMPAGYAPTMCHWVSGCVRMLLRTSSSEATVRQEWCMAHRAEACELKITWR